MHCPDASLGLRHRRVEAVAAAARLEATGCASSDEEVLDDRDVEARSNVKKRARRVSNDGFIYVMDYNQRTRPKP